MNLKQTFLIIAILSAIASCGKKEPGSPQEQLPPITHTGENTFGCLIDGKVFKPKQKTGGLGSVLQCNYQYFNNQYHFLLGASNRIQSASMAFGMLGVKIHGDTLLNYSYAGSGRMSVGYGPSSNLSYQYKTISNSPGEFRIEHFDSLKQIISGTFWFDAIDTATGETVQVRDGRFDVQFTY